MLGDLVEYNFSLVAGDAMTLGQSIGSVEGFKAPGLYGVASGALAGGNAALDEDPTLVDTDPYDRGWLYEVRGQPDPGAVNAADMPNCSIRHRPATKEVGFMKRK